MPTDAQYTGTYGPISYTDVEDLKQKAQLLLATGTDDRLMRVSPHTVLALVSVISKLEERLEHVDDEIESAIEDERREHEREVQLLNDEIADLNRIIESGVLL